MNQFEQRRVRPLVLVVDDDPVLRLVVHESLEGAGFDAEEAEDGAQGLAAFERLRPDAVLLDVMMPEVDGFGVCAAIRQHPGGDLIPVFMMTGLDDLASINRAFEVGATDFIAKPINGRLLGHHVRYMLRASEAFARLRRSEARNRALLNAMPDVMFRIDKGGILLESKGQKDACPLTGHGDLRGKRLDDVFPKDVARNFLECARRAIDTGEMQTLDYQLLSNGGVSHHEARIVFSGKDEVLAIIRDVTEMKRADERIRHLAFYDGMTGLPNRFLFKDRMEKAIAHAQRHKKKVAILFLDLDNFKHVNDTLGHALGDLLLQEVADRLVKCIRKTDTVARMPTEEVASTVARMGGDEYTVLLTDISTIPDVALVAQRMLDALSRPFVAAGHELFVSGSIGITVYPLDGEDADSLLRNADTAMYQAKERGRSNYQFYKDSMNAAATERFTLENHLRRALDRREFVLFYQPLVDVKQEHLVGVEALVRWRHPARGLLSPMTFIPLAEETGLIVPLGEWVLDAAVRQAKTWQACGLGGVRVSVNVSSVQFRKGNFVESLMRIISDVGFDAGDLEVELTEGIVMENAEATIARLHELRRLGVRLSIDDFGTGYSSLSYLRRFPINTLKIDRSFVKDLRDDPDSKAIVRTIIAMAESMNMAVIAEGVETKEQLECLRAYGCHQMQGFLFSRPLPADEFGQLLHVRRWGDPN